MRISRKLLSLPANIRLGGNDRGRLRLREMSAASSFAGYPFLFDLRSQEGVRLIDRVSFHTCEMTLWNDYYVGYATYS